MSSRLLTPTAALLWGLQVAFLNPVLALLLVALYGASPAQVGVTLTVYNAGGFVVSLIVPAWADRLGDYLRPMLGCAVLTLALAGALTAATTLPVAVVALLVLGGPASVGSSLLFAHLRKSGASPSAVINTRAIVSFAWVAGPPLATAILAAFGNRSILVALGVVAAASVAVTAALTPTTRSSRPADAAAAAVPDHEPVPRPIIALILVVFVLLQATDSAGVSIMGLFVTRDLGLPVLWSGVALGVRAALEIPALVVIGRLNQRVGAMILLASGCAAGVAYYAAMATLRGPALLVATQILDGWFFAAIAGIGLTLFQQIVDRPGLASGLYANTRRLGAIVSGPLIALGSATAMGYSGVFAVSAAMTGAALVVTVVLSRSRPLRSS